MERRREGEDGWIKERRRGREDQRERGMEGEDGWIEGGRRSIDRGGEKMDSRREKVDG